jgi:GNAT superfamily N-acetyltransferase
MSRFEKVDMGASRQVAPTLPRAMLKMRAIVHRVLRNLSDYGWAITLQKTAAYLARGIFFRQVYRIYRIKLDTASQAEDPGTSDFAFKLLTAQNTDLIAQVEETAEWLHGQIRKRLEAGNICLVALDGDKVAGFNLINLSEASLILVNRRIRLRKGSAWSEHIAVQKDYRKSGLGAQLRYRVFEELRSRGIHRLYGGTLRSNTAALRLTRAVGFREIGDIHYQKILSFQEWRFERLRK